MADIYINPQMGKDVALLKMEGFKKHKVFMSALVRRCFESDTNKDGFLDYSEISRMIIDESPILFGLRSWHGRWTVESVEALLKEHD